MGRIRVKRGHTDKHPAMFGSSGGSVRDAIVKHLHSLENSCTWEEYKALCDDMASKNNMNYNPYGWHIKNHKYVREVKVPKRKLKLTRAGRNLAKLLHDAG